MNPDVIGMIEQQPAIITKSSYIFMIAVAIAGAILMMLGLNLTIRFIAKIKTPDFLRIMAGLAYSGLGTFLFFMPFYFIERTNFATYSILQLPAKLFVILLGFTVVAIYTIISLVTGYEIPLYEKEYVD